MDIIALRQIMGLTQEQIATELGVSQQAYSKYERGSMPEHVQERFVEAFPISPEYAKTGEGDPFLPCFEQSTPGQRLAEWRETYHISRTQLAAAISVTEDYVREFENNPRSVVRMALGKRIEKLTGIHRKWLMYGDTRDKGTCLLEALPQEDAQDASEESAGVVQARRLKEARMLSGMTLKQLADILEISYSRVSQMEHGAISEQRCDEILEKIAQYKKK